MRLEFDVHDIAFDPHRKYRLALRPLIRPASRQVEGPLMAGADDPALEYQSLGKMAAFVHTDVGERKHLSVHVEERDRNILDDYLEPLAQSKGRKLRGFDPVSQVEELS